MLISEFSWKSRSCVTTLQNARTNWTWRDEAKPAASLFKRSCISTGDDAMKLPASVLTRIEPRVTQKFCPRCYF